MKLWVKNIPSLLFKFFITLNMSMLTTLGADEFYLRESFKATEAYNTYISPSYIYYGGTVITSPGYYLFVGDIFLDPTANGQIGISIACDNVIVDFNSYRLTQHLPNTYTGSIGIYVSPGCHNVLIKNGSISSLTGVGIYLDSGASDINMSNIDISNINGGGIQSNGANGILLSDVVTDDMNSTTTTATFGFSFNNSNVIEIRDCSCSNNNAALADTNGMIFTNCTSVRIAGCLSNHNVSGNLNAVGYNLTNCTAIQIADSVSLDNICTFTNTNSTLLTPLLLTLTTITNLQNLIGVNKPTAATGPIGIAAGFVLNNCSGAVIERSKSVSHSSATGMSYGFGFAGGTDNELLQSYAFANAGAINGIGVICSGTESRSVINGCKISGNGGISGIGAGIFSGTLTRSLVVTGNNIMNHNLTNSLNGIGVADSIGTLTTNRYFANILMGNTVGFNLTSVNAPIYGGAITGTPGPYQNVVL